MSATRRSAAVLDRMARVLRALESAGPAGLTTPQLVEDAGLASSQQVHGAVNCLRQAGCTIPSARRGRWMLTRAAPLPAPAGSIKKRAAKPPDDVWKPPGRRATPRRPRALPTEAHVQRRRAYEQLIARPDERLTRLPPVGAPAPDGFNRRVVQAAGTHNAIALGEGSGR